VGLSHVQRLGATVAGFPPYRGIGAGPSKGGHIGHGRSTVFPYAVPIYVGGFDYGYGYGYPPPPPNVTVVAPPAPAQPPAPPVIINQYYTPETARPVMREYNPGSLPEAGSGLRMYQAPSSVPYPEPARDDSRPTIFLIAFKDGSIYPAVAYWVESGTLHYVTQMGSHNRASLDLIDRAFSEQLNRERNIDFKLPER
jgi:hypothetical protein